MADWITTEEAVKLSGYNPEYIRQLIRHKKITAQKWGQAWQISRSSLLAYKKIAEQSDDKRWGAKKRS